MSLKYRFEFSLEFRTRTKRQRISGDSEGDWRMG